MRAAQRPTRRWLRIGLCLILTGTVSGVRADDAQSLPPASNPVTQTWSREDAAHLLRRAAFGGTPEQIDALHALGRDAAIDYLITGKLPDGAKPVFAKAELPAYEVLPIPDPDPAVRDQMRELQEKVRKEGQDSDANRQLEALRRRLNAQQQANERNEVNHVRTWWIDRMLRTDRPLEEKMTLFWHNLFTSGFREVRTGKLMSSQVVLFHNQALGNYRKLTHSILHDGAMLRYLNNDQNVRGKPNENLARELMELFTLGEGNGYTEQDIKEVARALTGLAPGGGRFGGGGGGRYAAGAVSMRSYAHDNGTKVIFGKSGNFGPDDVVDLIFSRPEPAKYLAKRLWTAFAYPDPSEEDLAPVLKAIQESKYDLQPALRAMFSSPAFYSDKAKFALIKSPAELAVGTMRLLGRDVPNEQQVMFVGRQMSAMDQELLQPPNVRGWVGGDNWITAATLFTRYNTASSMVAGSTGGGSRFGGRFGGGGAPPTPEQMQMFQQQRARPFGVGAESPAGQTGAQKSLQQVEAQMRQRAAESRNAPGTQPAEKEVKAAPAGAQDDTANLIQKMRERRAAAMSNSSTRPAAAQDFRADMRQQMAANPALREQMMQQFAGRRGGGAPGGGSPMQPVEPAKLLKVDPSSTNAQIVDAAISRFLQRPLHPDKRRALLDAMGEEPLKIGTPDGDNRIRQIITLVLSTPEYQVQ